MMKSLFSGILILSLITMAACSGENQNGKDGLAPGAEPLLEEASSGEVKAASLKLYTLDCGQFEFKDMALFGSKNEYDGLAMTLTVPCFLIRHEKGDFLWDAGLPDAINAMENGMVSPFSTATVPITLESQLNSLGLEFSDIEYFSASHTHSDHFGNAPSLSQSRILMRQSEYDFMTGYGLEAGLVSPTTVTEGVKEAVQIIEGEYDVFGDGSVIIVSAPGHTPGHNVLLINLENSGPYILSGDLYHLKKAREIRSVPQFNVSAEETLKSMEKIEQLIQDTGATFIIQHVIEDRKKLPNIPDYLD